MTLTGARTRYGVDDSSRAMLEDSGFRELPFSAYHDFDARERKVLHVPRLTLTQVLFLSVGQNTQPNHDNPTVLVGAVTFCRGSFEAGRLFRRRTPAVCQIQRFGCLSSFFLVGDHGSSVVQHTADVFCLCLLLLRSGPAGLAKDSFFLIQ